MIDNSEVKALVEQLNEILSHFDWGQRERFPALRDGVSTKRIDAYEAKIGGKLPDDYRAFLELANGMEGASGSEWILRGTSEPRSGTKFAVVEREYFPSGTYKPRMKFMRDEFSPTAKDSLLVATDFVYHVAVLRKDDDGDFLGPIEIYCAPDLTAPIVVFGTFTDLLTFIVDDYQALHETPYGDNDYDFETDDAATLDPYAPDTYEDYLEDLDLIEDYDEADDDEFPRVRKKSAKKKDLPSASTEELDAILAMVERETGRAKKEARQVEETLRKPAPPAQQPEMQRASKLVEYVVQNLLDNEYLELQKNSAARADLEDLLLRKLLSSNNPKHAVRNWFELLLTADVVVDLYGTDEDVKDLLFRAFDEFENA